MLRHGVTANKKSKNDECKDRQGGIFFYSPGIIRKGQEEKLSPPPHPPFSPPEMPRGGRREFGRRSGSFGFRSPIVPLLEVAAVANTATVLEADAQGDSTVIVQSGPGIRPVVWQRHHVWIFGGVGSLLVLVLILSIFIAAR
jgi:hypothetical protein